MEEAIKINNEQKKEMTKEEAQFNKMTNTSVKKLVLTLGIPTTISMLVTAIYNIGDTFFVSQLGKSASGAVGVVFSLMAIIQAVGFTFGMGAGSIISSKLGERKEKEAQIVGSSSFYVAVVVGTIISIFSLIFLTPLMKLLGATDTVLPYAKGYGLFIICGFPIMVASFVMNNLLRAEGKAKLAMIGLTTGGILNLLLDPLFIFVFDLGIKGAAIATLVSQFISFSILLSMFLFKKSIIKLSIFYVTKDFSVYSEIIKVGFPSFVRQGLASISTILLNHQAALHGGDAALSAISIVNKIYMVVFSVALGIGQGYQPVCGYNFFAKKYKRVREAVIFTYICGTIAMTTFCVLLYIFANNIMGFFIDDREVIDIGIKALTYESIALPFLCVNVVCNMTFQSIRQKVKATFLSACRQGVFFLPLIFILPKAFGLNGVVLVQSVSDFMTFMISIPFFINILKRTNINSKEVKNVQIA